MNRNGPRGRKNNMADDGYYLYGIIKNKPDINDLPGIDGRGKVFLVHFDGMAGIASIVNLAEFGEVPLKKNLESMDWVREKVLGHERVVEAIMKQATVIPMKFCTIFNSPERIKELLEKKQVFFTKLLEAFSDKQEWGVKAYCRKDQGMAIKPTATGREYLLMKKKQYEVSLEYERKVNILVEKIFNKINILSELSKINRPTPNELLPHKDKEQVLNASFLVRKSKEKQLSVLVDELAGEHREEGLTVELIGPLPVYNFVTAEGEGISNGNSN